LQGVPTGMLVYMHAPVRLLVRFGPGHQLAYITKLTAGERIAIRSRYALAFRKTQPVGPIGTAHRNNKLFGRREGLKEWPMSLTDRLADQKVICTICGKKMKLHRRVSAPALGKGYEYGYFECVCGNVKVIESDGYRGSPKGD
jgi:hypothetical protein